MDRVVRSSLRICRAHREQCCGRCKRRLRFATRTFSHANARRCVERPPPPCYPAAWNRARLPSRSESKIRRKTSVRSDPRRSDTVFPGAYICIIIARARARFIFSDARYPERLPRFSLKIRKKKEGRNFSINIRKSRSSTTRSRPRCYSRCTIARVR